MPPRRRHYEGFVICDHNVPQRGKMMTWNMPFYEQRIMDDAEFRAISPQTLSESYEEPKIRSLMLEWKRGLIIDNSPYHDREIDFWVPAGESVAWAIDKLLSSYTEQARKERAR